MAFLLSKSNTFAGKVSPSLPPFTTQRRGFHIDLGDREKALLADDPALKNFKSYKPAVRRIKRIGDALTVVVVAACCYEMYQHGVMRTKQYEERHQG